MTKIKTDPGTMLQRLYNEKIREDRKLAPHDKSVHSLEQYGEPKDLRVIMLGKEEFEKLQEQGLTMAWLERNGYQVTYHQDWSVTIGGRIKDSYESQSEDMKAFKRVTGRSHGFKGAHFFAPLKQK